MVETRFANALTHTVAESAQRPDPAATLVLTPKLPGLAPPTPVSPNARASAGGVPPPFFTPGGYAAAS